jgi:hypothetical protein
VLRIRIRWKHPWFLCRLLQTQGGGHRCCMVYLEPTPTQTQSTTKPSNNPIALEMPFPWRNHTQRRSRIHGHSGPRCVEKALYRMHPPQSPRNNRASLVRALAVRGGLMSRINDDMLMGAIATSPSLWITGITIAVCYLMIRR